MLNDTCHDRLRKPDQAEDLLLEAQPQAERGGLELANGFVGVGAVYCRLAGFAQKILTTSTTVAGLQKTLLQKTLTMNAVVKRKAVHVNCKKIMFDRSRG